ncbi:hypothetical protein SUGI_1446870 [Cryptomeria japonica]|uniref:Uncharacterized protein n=1 Tax=Cryptomeria japonica TaxID=3369 RepID=A0AAD3RR41_CRYJA|nr:hypothetical protein SUGI_1446870 [Cryptomeria japonica]
MKYERGDSSNPFDYPCSQKTTRRTDTGRSPDRLPTHRIAVSAEYESGSGSSAIAGSGLGGATDSTGSFMDSFRIHRVRWEQTMELLRCLQ